MLNVISDPNLYLLFFAAYVVGFIDLDDPTGQHAGWGRVSDIAFWCGLGIAVTLFATHGFAGGAAGMLAAWAISLVGLRRGVLAQRRAECSRIDRPRRIVQVVRGPLELDAHPPRRPRLETHLGHITLGLGPVRDPHSRVAHHLPLHHRTSPPSITTGT